MMAPGGKILDTLIGWVAPRRNKSEAAAPGRHVKARRVDKTTSPAKQDLAKSVSEIEETLTAIARDGKRAVAGKVQVLNFNALRDEVGAEWDRIGDKVTQVIETAIRDHSGAHDKHWPMGEFAYLLVFSSLTPREAEVKTALIAAQVEKYFTGTPQLSGKIEISTAVTRVSGGIKLRPIDDLDTLFSKLENEAPPPATDDTPATAAAAGETTVTRRGRSEEEEEVRMLWRRIGVDPDTLDRQLASMAFARRPVWEVANRSVMGWAFASRRRAGITRQLAGSALGPGAEDALSVPLDLLTLEHMRGTMDGAGSVDDPAWWVTQVHYQSLISLHRRQKLVAAVVGIPENLREHLAFELVALPSNVYGPTLNEAIQVLAPHVAGVALCCDLEKPQFAVAKGGRVLWVGFSMSGSTLVEDEAIEAIGAFVNSAERVGAQVYARDLPTRHLAIAAASLGVRIVFGKEMPGVPVGGVAPPPYREEELYAGDPGGE